MAPATALAMSERVEVMTRAGEGGGVETVVGRDDEVGIERACGGLVGHLAIELIEEPRGGAKLGIGSIGSRPWRRRPKAARAEGAIAVMARACSRVGGQTVRRPAPQAE